MKPIERRDLDSLLAAAREGTAQGVGELFARYHNYIELLVSTQLDGRLSVTCSASDTVRDAFGELQRCLPKFHGNDEAEFLAWLRQNLANHLVRIAEQDLPDHERRPYDQQSVERLVASLEQSTTRLEAVLIDHDHAVERNLQRADWGVVLADELAEMPRDYSQILRLRHMHGLAFTEVARRMERSLRMVRVLWVRAINVLRERLKKRGVP
jgi:RNA polymerase sigma-70 factor (ECF subfamily)